MRFPFVGTDGIDPCSIQHDLDSWSPHCQKCIIGLHKLNRGISKTEILDDSLFVMDTPFANANRMDQVATHMPQSQHDSWLFAMLKKLAQIQERK
jgi:hypothetical protein